MQTVEDFDLVVLGSGEAGKYLAWTLGSQGQRVAVVERRFIGGSCPNIACLPSKNVIHTAKVVSYFRHGSEFGLPTIETPVDMTVVRERKRKMVDGLVEMHEQKFHSSGAELIMGSGAFVAPKTIEVILTAGGTRTLRGKNVVISTGSRARIDNTLGLRDAKPMTHIDALELDQVPPELIILGGGYIGLEMAQALQRLGSHVTIIEKNPTVIHREDSDVTRAVQELFDEEGIRIITGATIERIEGTSGEQIKAHIFQSGSFSTIEGTHLLVAGGRTPNTDNIGLQLAGIELESSGHIHVNYRLQTTAEGVWAVGDCAGSPHFTHIALDDFRVVLDNLAGIEHTTSNRQVPYCLFTDPELAHVGLSEREAASQSIPYRLFKIPMVAVLRTRTLGETRGFLKALVDNKSDHILGFTAFGIGAGEYLAPIQLAMTAGLPYTMLRDTILTHPTMSEGLGVLFSSKPN